MRSNPDQYHPGQMDARQGQLPLPDRAGAAGQGRARRRHCLTDRPQHQQEGPGAA